MSAEINYILLRYMKQFFKMVFATVCGIAIFLLIAGFFMVISLVGMLASDSAPTKVEANSVFVIKLDGTIEVNVPTKGHPLTLCSAWAT